MTTSRFFFTLSLLAAVLCAAESFAQDVTVKTPIVTKAASKTAAKPFPAEARIPPPGPAELPLLPASDFSDSRSSIEISLPAGWRAVEGPRNAKTDITTLILIDGPGSPEPTCHVIVRAPKQPPKITQAQINKIMYDERNVQMVRKNLAQGGREVQSVTRVSNHGVNGLQSRLLMPGNEHRPDVTVMISFFEMVGQAYSFECSALTADLDNAADDIDMMVKSARLTKS
jgi:hypothetical protein